MKLKLQYFCYLMRTDDSFEKTLMLGKIEGRRRRGRQRMRWLEGIINSTEIVKVREAWCAAAHGVTNVRYDLVTEQQEEQGLMCGYEV